MNIKSAILKSLTAVTGWMECYSPNCSKPCSSLPASFKEIYPVRSIIILTIILLSEYCLLGQPNIQEIRSNMYYDFFNSINSNDSNKRCNLLSNFPATIESKDTSEIFSDSIFSVSDKIFMRKQLANAKKFTWEHGKIKNKKVLSYKKIRRLFRNGNGWKKFHEKYGGGYETYSIPIFSIERKYCTVYTGAHCGNLCGMGGTNLYKLVSNKWVLFKIYSIWIS